MTLPTNPFILIPAAGAGRRFREAGYDRPKWAIDVAGIPMIDRVKANLGSYFIDTVMVVLEEDVKWAKDNNFHLGSHVVLPKLTRGAAETVSMALEKIFVTPHLYLTTNEEPVNRPLVVANCDQIESWDKQLFYKKLICGDSDGLIVTIQDHKEYVNGEIVHSIKNWQNYSYVDARYDIYGDVETVRRVAEKECISDVATTGIYSWRFAGSCFDACNELVFRNETSKGEFYLSPAYNINIEWGAKIKHHLIGKHWSLGTPEELNNFIAGIKPHETV